MAKKTKSRSKNAVEQLPKLPAAFYLARMNGAKDRLFANKTDAIKYVEKKAGGGVLFGCKVVEFGIDGKPTSTLRLDTKLQTTTIWSAENE